MNQEKIFISYKRDDVSQKVAEEVEYILKKKGYNVIKDTSHVKYKDSISKFIERLGNSKFVILVISDAYLKSKFCIQELLLLSKHDDFIDRIFPIVLNDASIYDAEFLLDYIVFWENKKATLESKLKSLKSIVHTKAVSEDLDFYSDIRAKFDQVVNYLRNMNTYGVSSNSYTNLILSIERKMILNREVSKKSSDWQLNIPVKKVSIDSVNQNKLIEGVTFLSDRFNKTTLSTEELNQLYEVQQNIFNPIIQEFKSKILANINVKEDFVKLLFNRITQYEDITDLDREYINFIRENTVFDWHEKKMLVSALTIGCLNKFDDKKINLLIDFSLSSEDKIWQTAFVGLILSLQLHRNKISSFPHLERSLRRIGESNELQNSLHKVALILRRKNYSAEVLFKDDKFFEEYFMKMLDFMPKDLLVPLEITQTDIIDLFHYKKNNPDDEIVNSINIEALELDFKSGKREVEIRDVLKYMNVKNFILKHEANPLMLPYFKDEISSINWFLPFFMDKLSIKNFIQNLPESIEDSNAFLEWLKDTAAINNIDKYFIICNYNTIDPIAFEMLNSFRLNEDKLLKNQDAEYIEFVNIIREIYRFVLFFNDKTHKKVFKNEIELSDGEILKYVSDDLILNKLKGFALFEKNKLEDAKEKFLDFHKINGKDLDVIQALISIEKGQNNYSEIIEFSNKKISILSSDLQRREIYDSYYEIFDALKAQERYDEALSCLMKIENLFHIQEKDSVEIGEVNLDRGLIYSLKGEKRKAILYHFKSFRMLKNKNHKNLLSIQYNIFISFNRVYNSLNECIDSNDSVAILLNEKPEMLAFVKKLLNVKLHYNEFKNKVLKNVYFGKENLSTIRTILIPIMKDIDEREKGKYKFILLPLLDFLTTKDTKFI